jgi:hypothetical protein
MTRIDLPDLDETSQTAAFVGLANNPEASARTLLALLAHVPACALLGLMGGQRMMPRLGALPDKVVEAIVAQDPIQGDRLEQDERVSPGMRDKLVAGANSPERRLARRQWTLEFVQYGCVTFALRYLEALTETTGPDAWEELSRHPQPKVRMEFARTLKEPPVPIRRALLTDPEPSVKVMAARSYRRIPADLMPQLLGDPAIRADIVPFAELTPEFAAEIAAEEDEAILIGLAQNPTLPPALYEQLAEYDHPWIWAFLIGNEACPDRLRAMLYEDIVEHSKERIGVGQPNPGWPPISTWFNGLPLERALDYLDHPIAIVRYQLARRHDLPQAAIETLSRDPDPLVRWNVADHPNAPSWLEDELARLDPVKFYDRKPDALTAQDAVRFARDPNPGLRRIACHYRGLGPDVVSELTEDADDGVRLSAAQHPNLPAADAVALLGDENAELVQCAAACPALPTEAVDHILAYAARFNGSHASG